MRTLKPKAPSTCTVLTLALLVTTMVTPSGLAQTTKYVDITDFAFLPEKTYIEKGDTIAWTNHDPVIYTLWFVHSENQSTYQLSSPIAPGETWQHTFDLSARLEYFSLERLWITGTARIYRLIGDVNGDGTVDIFDIGFISAHWYPGPPIGPLGYDEEADINLDGAVDIFDIGITSANWGRVDP